MYHPQMQSNRIVNWVRSFNSALNTTVITSIIGDSMMTQTRTVAMIRHQLLQTADA